MVWYDLLLSCMTNYYLILAEYFAIFTCEAEVSNVVSIKQRYHSATTQLRGKFIIISFDSNFNFLLLRAGSAC